MVGPRRVAESWVHLGLGATAVPQPPFDGMGACANRLAADGRETRLRAGDYAINAPGVWHIADIEEKVTAIFITAGEKTQRRPR